MGRPRRLRVLPEAVEELDATVAWYEHRSPGLGGRLLAAVDTALARLQENPSTGAPVPGVPRELAVRSIALHRFPYFVVFMEQGEDIRILAFAHMRRRPGYWRRRGSK